MFCQHRLFWKHCQPSMPNRCRLHRTRTNAPTQQDWARIFSLPFHKFGCLQEPIANAWLSHWLELCMTFTGTFAGDPFKDSLHVFSLFPAYLLLSLVSAADSERSNQEYNIWVTHICSFKTTVDFNRSICCIPFWVSFFSKGHLRLVIRNFWAIRSARFLGWRWSSTLSCNSFNIFLHCSTNCKIESESEVREILLAWGGLESGSSILANDEISETKCWISFCASITSLKYL